MKRVSGGETHYVSITVLVAVPGATDEHLIDYINRYDVLSGIVLSRSPENGTLVASPGVDLVPDVTKRAGRKPLASWPAVELAPGVTARLRFLRRRNMKPTGETTPTIAQRFGRLMTRLRNWNSRQGG